ncbi:MAG: PhzF family phenazine biosynthesis protein [Gemmatimonadaceae bacterium]
MKRRFFTLDVFTETPLAGNQLAVFPDAAGLPGDRLQAIARELNLSETVFVYPPLDPLNTARVRIFTPAVELPFAGHPTVGTAILLATLKRVRRRGGKARVVLEEGVGAVPVEVRYSGSTPTWAQLTTARLPEGGPPPPDDAVLAAAISLEPADLDPDMPPAAFSCGVPFLFVPVRNRSALAAASPDLVQWRAALGDYWAPDLFLFTRDAELSGSDFSSRMFAPLLGVPEDPATGSAVAALAGYLAAHERLGDGRHNWRIEQGFKMGRPSIIELESDVRDGIVYTVRVGGNAVLVSEGELRLG